MGSFNRDWIYEKDLEYDEVEALICAYVFDETDRKILKRFLLDGLTYEAVAEEFNISTPTAFSKIKKHVAHLSKKALKRRQNM